VKAVLSLLCVTAFFAVGCSERVVAPVSQSQSAAETNTARSPSTLGTAGDGFTGRAAVKAGREAQDKLRAVSAERNADLDEAQGNRP
jgi:hypothetical protein